MPKKLKDVAQGIEDRSTEVVDMPEIPKKILWQRENRRQFKAENGYSTNAHYATDGLRKSVLERDGFACVKCGMSDSAHKTTWNRPITIDHINKNHSDNRMENLQTLCLPCHGAKDITPYLKEKQVEPFKTEILARRASGETYQSIANRLGFSVASIWKWFKRWNTV